MSGGVDSSASAVLLLNKGYDVSGAYFDLWDKSDSSDAEYVCNKLGIPFMVLDFKDTFKNSVMDYFVNSYKTGITPNPCIECNKNIKFGRFLDKALELGFDFIATGHYAENYYDENKNIYRLKKSGNIKKDQSYFLYNLNQNILKHVIFPVGSMNKDDIRKIAYEAGLRIHSKNDSQDICFIPGGDYVGFLENAGISKASGSFVDIYGNVLGAHKGIWHYTIGQRKGLGISLGRTMYVSGIDSANQNVILSEDEAPIFKDSLCAGNISWVEDVTLPINAKVKIRYAHKEQPALITGIDENTVRVKFDDAQRAITRGQSVVFYDGDFVLGGGVILVVST